jgi:hypothetical protein
LRRAYNNRPQRSILEPMSPRHAPWLFLAVMAGCTTDDVKDSGTAAELPLISPPVRAATPSGLQGSSARAFAPLDAPVLRASDLRERFFSGSGPTDVMRILGEIDLRLAEVNSADRHPACLDLPPVPYTITPAGHNVELVAQCYRRFSPSMSDVAFLQFGVVDGKTSLYIAVGAARLAALISPIAGTTDHVVDAWYGVGYNNVTSCGSTGTFDDCSYALTELHANPATKALEMAVAGVGVGFCGVQFASDGTELHGVGSTDMGSSCNDRATFCSSATDLDMPSTCASPAPYLMPAIGRRAGAGAHEFGVSRYPEAPNITLDGTMTDSLYFGPQAPTPGAGDFDEKS